MQLVLRAAGIIGIIVSVIWWAVEPSFDPLYAFITGLVALLSSFIIPQQETKAETLDQRNRRVMLDHVENFWVKGILEKSLNGVALLELGIKENPSAVNYPWGIRREPSNETIPAGNSILEIFQEIGMGRSLLILGAPGSGKTTMLLALTSHLIKRARLYEFEPIPVVFNLASWKEGQTLTHWLAEQLNLVYYVPRKTAATWVHENRMALLLDGMDEVRADLRAKCVEAINEFRKEHGLTSLVVCSRIGEYSILTTKLSLEGGITLQPLTSEQVNNYIDGFGKSLSKLKQLLDEDSLLRELAETPLMLSIMALAYKDIQPDELPASKSVENQRKHLFNTYIDNMFKRLNRSRNARFTKQETLHYLNWLARTMINHNIINYQIESMQPYWLWTLEQHRLYRLYVVLIVGLSFGLIVGLLGGLIFGLGFRPIFGLISGLILGLFFGLLGGLSFGLIGARDEEIIMADKLTWSWKEAWLGLRAGLITGLIGLLIGGLTFALIFGLGAALIAGLGVGLIGLLLAGLIFGLSSEQIEETTYPAQRLKQSLFSGLFTTLIFGLISGLILGLSVGWIALLDVGLSFGLSVGLGLGLIVGLIGGLIRGYIPLIQHYSLRLVLARHHFLPHRLIAFLEYTVHLIFLRRVGGSYIFVHRLLMEHFAEMDV